MADGALVHRGTLSPEDWAQAAVEDTAIQPITLLMGEGSPLPWNVAVGFTPDNQVVQILDKTICLENDCQATSDPNLLGFLLDPLGNLFTAWADLDRSGVILAPGLELGGISDSVPVTKTGDTRQVTLWGLSPNGQTLAYTYSACATCGAFILQTAGDERVLGRWEGWPAWPGSDFSHDGHYALIRLDQGGAVLSGQTLIVYDILEERAIYRTEAERNDFGPAVFLGVDAAAHFRLAYGFDEQGAAVNTISLEIITLPEAQAILYPVAVNPAWQSGSPVAAASPDGKLLAFSYGSGTLWLVDAGSGRIVRNWQAHADEIRSLTFSPDGLFLASFGLDGLVKVWGIK